MVLFVNCKLLYIKSVTHYAASNLTPFSFIYDSWKNSDRNPLPDSANYFNWLASCCNLGSSVFT